MWYYFELLKNFLTKKDYDFDRRDVNLYNFHPQLLFIVASQGTFYRNPKSYARFVWPFLSVSLTIVGVSFESMFLIKGLTLDDDYSFAIESFSYLVLLGVIPLVFFGSLTNKSKIINLLDDMNEDFVFICSLGPKYRKPFLKNQLLIWQLCIGWLSFACFVACMFIMFPMVILVYQSLFATQHEDMIRPLLFPMWLPHDDAYRTPNYEMFMVLHLTFSITYSFGFGGYVYLLFHFLLHYYTVMEMIILDFDGIFDGLDESVAILPHSDPRRIKTQLILNKRLGRIVNWHLSAVKALQTLSSAFGMPLVYQVMFSSFAICLMAYQIASVCNTLFLTLIISFGIYEDFEHGKINILFTLLFIGACAQLWIPCYLGTLVKNKGLEVGDACWNCGWERTLLGQMIRPDIIIIITRSQIPMYMKFSGLPNLQLETFSSIMSTSYSYFNMLRQYS